MPSRRLLLRNMRHLLRSTDSGVPGRELRVTFVACGDGCGRRNIVRRRMPHRVLLDSNVLIAVLNGAMRPDVLHAYGAPSVSAVTVMEVYALAGMSAIEERTIDAALRLLDVLPVDAVIGKYAGVLARTRKRGKPDLLIAATALVYDCALVTLNVRDFRNIPGLRAQKP